MKSLKNVFVAATLSAAVAMPAFASESPSLVAPLPQFSAADASLIFETDATPMQLAALSQQEMKETEGAVIWNGIIGGGAGLGIYLYNTPRDQWSLGGAAWNTAVGVASGYGVAGLGARVIGPYVSGGWGVTISRPSANVFQAIVPNSQQIFRGNFSGITPTVVHHRWTPNVGFNAHQPWSSISNVWRR